MEDRQYFSLPMSLAVLEANFGREDTKDETRSRGRGRQNCAALRRGERGGKFQTPKQQNIDLFHGLIMVGKIYWLLHNETNDNSEKLRGNASASVLNFYFYLKPCHLDHANELFSESLCNVWISLYGERAISDQPSRRAERKVRLG